MSDSIELKPPSDQKDVEALIEFLIDGLTTDGAHHKQWFLEAILAVACGLVTYEDLTDWRAGSFGDALDTLRREFSEDEDTEWDEGIAP